MLDNLLSWELASNRSSGEISAECSFVSSANFPVLMKMELKIQSHRLQVASG